MVNIPAGRIAAGLAGAIIILLILGYTVFRESPSSKQEPPDVTPGPAATPLPALVPNAVPDIIKQWSGTGNMMTVSFHIDEEPFVIEWSFAPERGASQNYLKIEVVNVVTNGTVAMPAYLADAESIHEGTLYIFEEGTFYLDIDCQNGSWDIRLLGPNG